MTATKTFKLTLRRQDVSLFAVTWKFRQSAYSVVLYNNSENLSKTYRPVLLAGMKG